MATTDSLAPPPPPMPGTAGALPMPNWRDNYRPPVHESAPSKEQIEKQQYAHLPDKLLNTLNKDKKPFTYTPQGISSERGVLDMSEIRSPRMKKRLMANLHAGEEDTEDSADERPNSSSSNPVMNGQIKHNLYQQPINPLVLPPLSNDRLKPRSPSPNFAQQQQQRKEVRFAPSPILVSSDDEELQNVLQKRRLDVEARAKIVTNDPVSSESTVAQPTHVQLAPEPHMEFDVDQLVKNASEAVQSARKIFGNESIVPSQQVWDSNNNLVEQEEIRKEAAHTTPKTIATEYNEADEMIHQLECDLNREVRICDEPEKTVERREEAPRAPRAPPPPPPPSSTPWRVDLNNSNHRSAPVTFEAELAPKMAVSAQHNHFNQGNFYHQQVPPPPKPTVNYKQSDILKHLLDDGLQDEIDKFEEISRETAMSPSMTNYAPVRKAAPPPVPPKPQGYHHDGRTSCPPFADHNNNNLTDGNNFANSFRCISPSFEILKNLREQNSGYNYASKPRPFYRFNEQPEPMDYRATSQHTFRPVETASSYEHFNGRPSERIVPIQSTHNYASLPRKIKLNTDLSISHPRTYDNKEAGREFLNNCGMFSQLPPSDSVDDSPTTPPTPSKMFYGLNPRQPNAIVNQVNQVSKNPLAQPKTYENPEEGREFLNSASMFSQLPPEGANNYQQYSSCPNYNSSYGSGWRQSSLPPATPTMSRNVTPVPVSATPPPPVNSMNAPKQPRLSMSQLRKIPPSERPPEPTPSKYTGSHIPSRSFRILQLITGEDIENQYSDRDEMRAYQAPPIRQASMPPTSPSQASPSFQHQQQKQHQQPQMVPTISTTDYGTDF